MSDHFAHTAHETDTKVARAEASAIVAAFDRAV